MVATVPGAERLYLCPDQLEEREASQKTRKEQSGSILGEYKSQHQGREMAIRGPCYWKGKSEKDQRDHRA